MADIFKEYMQLFDYIETVYQAKKFPKFKVTLKGAANNIKNLVDSLLRKSLLKQDLYQYEENDGFRFFLP